MADQHGIVEATVPGLAAFANVSVQETEAALEKFLSPDKYSRTTDCEGRRIEVIDGGWQLLNYQKYRQKLSEEDRKQQAAVRQQRYRDRQARNAKRNASVTNRDGDDLLRPSPQAEADRKTQRKTLAFNSTEAGQGYCHTFSVVGQKNYDDIRDAIEVEGQHSADEPQQIANRMIAARQMLEEIPKTERGFDGGAVWFITSGTWKKPENWRKDGQSPAGERKPLVIPSDEEAEKRFRAEARARRERVSA